jgi:uncharacterized membrane protein
MLRRGALGLLLIAACNSTPKPPNTACTPPPSYATSIAPIVARDCLPCHSQDNMTATSRRGAPPGVDFDTYAMVMARQGAFVDAVSSGVEPPARLIATASVAALTMDERNLVETWAGCGAAP